MQGPGAPRVSVIVTVADGALRLREALESVRAQTFTDWELIAWDSAPAEGAAAVVARFADPRMRHVRGPAGMAAGQALNAAIREARGEWLAFLDPDDAWTADKLALQAAIDDPAVGLIYGRSVAFAPGGAERDFDHRHEFAPLPQGDLFERLFAESCFIAKSSAMARRAAVLEIGLIPDWAELTADYCLHLELAHRHRVRAVQRVICRYRRHPASISHERAPRMLHEALRLIDRWSGSVDPALVAQRRRIHSTALAVEEMCRPGARVAGLKRLVRDGSVAYLLERPFVWGVRSARRRIYRPIWSQDAGEPVWSGAPTPLAGPTITLSVIVVNWKVRDLLRACLQSLQAQMQLAASEWEVHVVDNDSNDGSVEMVRAEFPQAHVIANRENVGFGRANDQAFAACRGRYVLLLNPDTVVLDHAVDRMLAIMESRPDIGALGCQLLNSDGSFQRWTGGNSPRVMNVAANFLFFNRVLPESFLPPPLYLESQPTRDVEVGWVSGACMLLRREAFRDTMFDERFFLYGEDVELCERLRMGEWKVVYTPSARVVHHQGKSLEHQTVKVRHGKMRGLRIAFEMKNSPALVPVYDVILVTGFLIRSVIFAVAAVVRPGHGYAARFAASRRFMADAFRSLVGR